jgi:plastocyanin
VSTGRMWRMLAAAGIAGAGLLAAVAPATNAVAATKPSTVHAVGIITAGTGFAFAPKSLSIPSGQSVKWTNKTSAPHTVTRCTMAACGVSGGNGTDPGPASGTLSHGQSYQLTFIRKGTYVYYCKIHGYAVMHGTLIVR